MTTEGAVWTYGAVPDLTTPPSSGRLHQAYLDGSFCFHQEDANGFYQGDLLGALAPGDVFRVGVQPFTVVGTEYAAPAWTVTATPTTMAPVNDEWLVPVLFDGPAAPPEPEPPPRPIADLGPFDTYATIEDLDTALGAQAALATVQRRSLALLIATRWVAYRVGAVVTDEVIDPVDPLVINPVPARPSWRQATVAAAVRFYKSPEVPFGVAGGWDMATYVRQSIPDVDLILYGQRQAWGVA